MDDKLETPELYVRKRRSRTGVVRIEVCDKETNRVLLTCKLGVDGFASESLSAVRDAAIEALRAM